MAYRTQINKRTLKAVAIAASNDSGRVSLCGVLVECRATTVTYVATNGHRMLVVQEILPELEEGEERLIGDFIIPSEAIKSLKVSRREGERLSLEAPDSSAQTAILGDIHVTFIDGTFPDWRRVLPAAQEPPADGNLINQFNAAYLGDFAKFAKMMEFDQPHIHHTAADRPTAITFGDHKAFGVLMPLRSMAALWARPDWVDGKAPEASDVKQAASF